MSVWGTKLVYRNLGYVADFCQICISARPFVLERIGAAKHILNISAGKGELVDYQRTCLHCSTAFRADPQQYVAVARNIDTIEPLMLETFPSLSQAHGARLALEQQILATPAAIDADTRGKLLLEPFTLLSPRVVKRFDGTRYEIAHAFVRREIIPLLGQTLARLHPSEQELQATLTELVQNKDLIGAKIKLSDLMADLSGRYAGKLPEVSATAVTHYASSGKPPYRYAATIFRVLGWILVACGVISILVVMTEKDANDRHNIFALLIFLAVTAASQFALYAGLERQKNWARICAILCSVAFLFLFPIGTVIGGYIIWSLTAGWER